MTLTLLIDKSGEIPGPEPVVDLHHRHPGGQELSLAGKNALPLKLAPEPMLGGSLMYPT
jgi:hypothetical protein